MPTPRAATDAYTRRRLTDDEIKRLPSPPAGSRIVYDTVAKGFGARITAAGARSFILTYRRKTDGTQRRYTIGSFPDWRTTAAREETHRLKRAIDTGADPLGELKQSRAAPTVRDLADRFLSDYVPRKRISTQRDYKRQIAVNILPAIGNLKVDAVTFADMDRLHRAMSERASTQANRTIAVASKMFTMAKNWSMRSGDNPCKGVERNHENKRKVYATLEELTRIAVVLDGLEDQGAANAIRLMLLTGARRGETLNTQWSDIHFKTKTWTKPASTTNQKGEHILPLSAAALALLKDMHEAAPANGGYLFPPPRGKTEHRLDLDDAWAIVRKTANVPHLRLHDLRHTYASVLVSVGLSLPVIGALLGHTTAQTTHRYAHLFDDPLRAATERASAIITGVPAAAVPAKRNAR
jgi:integrase